MGKGVGHGYIRRGLLPEAPVAPGRFHRNAKTGPDPLSLSLSPEQHSAKALPEHQDESWPLIAADEAPPFEVVNADGEAPFLLVCDHASRTIPRQLGQLGVADWVLDRHVACDIGARALTLALSERFDAPAVLAGYSRLVVDLNRQLHDASAFIKVSDGIAIPGNIELDEEERDLRIRSFFRPYHAAVSAALGRFTDTGRIPALISIHTCTPVYNRVVRRWHVGVMWDKDPRIARPLLANLGKVPDLCVGDNEPYSGAHPNDFTIDYHAERNGYPCVGIEVRQDLVDSPDGAEHWARLLAGAFEPVMAKTGLYTRLGDAPAP